MTMRTKSRGPLSGGPNKWCSLDGFTLIELLDEREDSINDGFFVVQMDGYPAISQTAMVDFPASYHSQAAGFAFADGHSEIHKWHDPRTYPPLTTEVSHNVTQPYNKDVNWLQDDSTRVY